MTPPARRLQRPARIAASLLAAVALGMLVVAALLRPDPSGRGTHRQLGLAPCGYLQRTGIPCPACGMTTGLAWAVRGRVDRAWAANPASVLLAPALVVLAPWLLAASATGRPLGARSIDGPILVLVVACVAFGLAAWSIRRFLGRE